jgi:hypothetical protein
MNRVEAIDDLVTGLVRMEQGNATPYPIPDKALSAALAHGLDVPNSKDRYAKFVCAVILGRYDDQIGEWKRPR